MCEKLKNFIIVEHSVWKSNVWHDNSTKNDKWRVQDVKKLSLIFKQFYSIVSQLTVKEAWVTFWCIIKVWNMTHFRRCYFYTTSFFLLQSSTLLSLLIFYCNKFVQIALKFAIKDYCYSTTIHLWTKVNNTVPLQTTISWNVKENWIFLALFEKSSCTSNYSHLLW